MSQAPVGQRSAHKPQCRHTSSSFTITLPVEVKDPAVQPAPALVSAAAQAGRRPPHTTVLVIDDDPAVHDLLRRSLEKEGYGVEFAADGRTGVELARQLKPAVITLDVMMPGLDGWSVLTALKADPKGAFFEIEGHTDNVGDKMYNQKLGQERADQVKMYLYSQHQIPLHRINVISYGEDKPVGDNKTKEGRAQNRRVVIRVLA